MMAVKQFRDDNFQSDVVFPFNTKPVLVDFYATWCQPCRIMLSRLEDIASAIGDDGVVGKLDVDANPEMTKKFMVCQLPTIIIFRYGKEVYRRAGLPSVDSLVTAMRESIQCKDDKD